MTADTTSLAVPKPAPSKLPVVIIAASAGGLDPISDILDSYPTDLPVATVVIQHLSPSYRSELVRLLQSHTAQPVRELGDNTVVEAGCIYVIQPGTQIMLDHQHVRAVTRNEFECPYFTIDVFLESVARRSAPIDACVVLLSGTGSDGTAGCRAMFDNGGYVLVQQLADAKFDGMPLSVINSGATTKYSRSTPLPNASWPGWLPAARCHHRRSSRLSKPARSRCSTPARPTRPSSAT